MIEEESKWVTCLSVGRRSVGPAFVSRQVDERKLSVERLFGALPENDLEDSVRSENIIFKISGFLGSNPGMEIFFSGKEGLTLSVKLMRGAVEPGNATTKPDQNCW